MEHEGSTFSFRVARVSGTVVVTACGVLDGAAAELLGDALVDLIDNQGNLDVVVDVRDLREGPQADLGVFATAARAATRRGGTLVLADPPADVAAALDAAGLGGRTVFSGGGAARCDGRRGGWAGPRPVVRPDGSPPATGRDGPRGRGA